MKKIISSILCLVMLFSLSIPASALIVDSSDSTGQSNDYVLTFSNEASYEIEIPAGGNVDKSTGKGVITIDISETNLAEGTAVSVTASSSNYSNGSWYLVNTKDATDKIAYTIGTTDGGSDVASGDAVVSADSATSASFYVTVSDTSKVGTFTDTITFTSEIVSTLISFTVDGTTYYAEENMAWRDFVESKYNVGDMFYSQGGFVGYSSSKFVIYNGSTIVFGSGVIIANAVYGIEAI